jgi:ATP-dependent RNA helicase DDX10/DBP4
MTLIDQHQFHIKYKINFADLPISANTLKGLNNRGFTKMTEVQRCSITHALSGRDVLVSSRTGSGKTLAYLIPLIEKLYRNRFIPMDGLGAVVVVPVRELAMQVFEVLNSFSEKLEMSVGLIIGGKDVKYEKDRIGRMNILICTPGRLLQHLEETYGFETSNLQMLVLDEADVMLEMGFREPLKAIMESLPKTQTLMFSATMTKDIYALANLSTNEP